MNKSIEGFKFCNK